MAQVPAEINAAEAALDNLQREVQPVDQQGAVQNEPAEAVAQVNAVRNNFRFSGVFLPSVLRSFISTCILGSSSFSYYFLIFSSREIAPPFLSVCLAVSSSTARVRCATRLAIFVLCCESL